MKSLICLILLSSPLFAQFTFAPIDVPGAILTEVRGVNVHGEVAGQYQTTPCPQSNLPPPPACQSKGFKFVNGAYTKLMVPKSLSTAITGLNDKGDLVGTYSVMQAGCNQPVSHGFIWYHQNVIRTIDAPGTGKCSNSQTMPMAMNNGTVVGEVDISEATGTVRNGFVWINGKFSTMNPLQTDAVAPCCWSVNGIANNGFLSGSLFLTDSFKAWFKNGKDEDFYGGPLDISTFGTGVNSNGDVVGFVQATTIGGYFAKHIELNEGTNDKEEVKPSLIKLLFPGSDLTYPFSINDLRWIGGMYIKGSDTHGFIAKPTF